MRLLPFVYVALWYLFNTIYSVANKKVLLEVEIPLTLSALDCWMGLPFVCLLWFTGWRPRPSVDCRSMCALMPLASLHAIGY